MKWYLISFLILSIHSYSYLIELQTELFTELNSQIGKIDELRSRIHEIDSLSRIIWLIIMSIKQMRLNGIDWDRNWYSLEYYFIDCIHVTIVTRWNRCGYSIIHVFSIWKSICYTYFWDDCINGRVDIVDL